MGAIRARIREVLAGFWLLPLVTGIAFTLLAFALVAVDRAAGEEGVSFGFPGDASAARSILSVVAGSLITVVAVTFSLTVVTLQLVSGQFTPRAIRGMLGNRTTQLVAGVFVGVVAYSLIVLRSVRDGADDTAPGLPALATTVAIVLALGALGLLIFFVHHIGATIQVSTVTARIGRQTLGVVDDLYHDPFSGVSGRDGHAVVAAWRAEHDGAVVRPARSGFVQTVAYSDIAEALPKGGRASIGVYPGDFVTPLTEVVELWTDRELEGVVEDVSKALVVADERDLRSDVAFGIRQLVDIALRALSPGINDPTSAVTAIGHVQAVLERLAGRAYPAAEVHVEGRIVVRRVPGFDEHLALGFVEVARDAFDNPRVSCALLEALALVRRAAVGAGAHERAAMVSALATRIGENAVAKSPTSHDADEVRRRLDAAVR